MDNQRLNRSLCGHTGSVICLSYWSSSLYGNYLITGSTDRSVKIWDLDKETVFHNLIGHLDCIRCVVCSKPGDDNPIIVSGGDDRSIKIWSLLKGNVMHSLSGHTAAISSLKIYSENGLFILISCGQDKSIRLWNLDTADFMYQLTGHHGAVNALAIFRGVSPIVVSGCSDKLIKVWDLKTGRLMRKLLGHEGRVTCVEVSPRGNEEEPIIVSGDSSGSIIVWDLKKLKKMYHLQIGSDDADVSFHQIFRRSDDSEPFVETVKFRGQVLSIALSDGPRTLIATTSWNMPVKIWDAKSGGLLQIIDGTLSMVNSVLFCSDGVGALVVAATTDAEAAIFSPEDDFIRMIKTLPSLKDISIELSLSLVGSFITYLRLNNGENALKWTHPSLSDNNTLISIFYCFIRFGHINSHFSLANVDVLAIILRKILGVVDLLMLDELAGSTPLQYLLEHRVCIGLAQDWMKRESNQQKVMSFLGDCRQSSETLDCVLSALVTNNHGHDDGWEVLLAHENFSDIFVNLFCRSPRTHGKLVEVLRSRALFVEPEPFPVPLKVRVNRKATVARWGDVLYDYQQGAHCYRVRINEKFPTEFFMTHKFLEELINSPFLEELVSTPFIEYIITYRWESWGMHANLCLAVLFFIYLMSAMSAVFCICSGHYDHCRTTTLHGASVTTVILINTVYMGISVLQFRMTSEWRSFFLNFWNISDICMISLCHVCILLGTAAGPSHAIRQICAVMALLMWSHSMYFGRGSKGLASLIHQMKVIIWEVRFFVVIMSLFVSSFAVAFRILGIYDSVYHAFILCFNMMLGDVAYENIRGHIFAEILYLVFLLSVAIILLNSLIAFMEGSLGSAREKEHAASVASQELEVKLLPFRKIAALFNIGMRSTRGADLSPSANLEYVPISSKNTGVHFSDDIGTGLTGTSNNDSGGTNSELVILVPEAFGIPDFLVKLENDPASAKDEQKQGEHRRLPIEMSNLANKGGGIMSQNYQNVDELHAKISIIEDKFVALDKKLDMVLNMLLEGKINSGSSSSYQYGTDESLTAAADSADSSARQSLLSSQVHQSTTVANARLPNSSIAHLSTPESRAVTYSYFGSEN